MERDGYRYLDVRTEAEFAEAHPIGACNVPFAVPAEQGLVPNVAFLDQVLARFDRSTKLVVGCATGVRSLAAARLLSEHGFEHVIEQRAGMQGVRDPFGRVRERGWRDEGLPTEYAGAAGEEERS